MVCCSWTYPVIPTTDTTLTKATCSPTAHRLPVTRAIKVHFAPFSNTSPGLSSRRISSSHWRHRTRHSSVSLALWPQFISSVTTSMCRAARLRGQRGAMWHSMGRRAWLMGSGVSRLRTPQWRRSRSLNYRTAAKGRVHRARPRWNHNLKPDF